MAAAESGRATVSAEPVETLTTSWTNVPIDFTELKRLAKLDNNGFVSRMKDLGVEVLSVTPSDEEIQETHRTLSSSSSGSSPVRAEPVDPTYSATAKLQADAHDPVSLQFVQAFKTSTAAGIYMPPGAGFDSKSGTQVNSTQRTFLLLKTCDTPGICANQVTRTHESIHHLIRQARVSSGISDPQVAGQREEEAALRTLQNTQKGTKDYETAQLNYLDIRLNRRIQTIGEELDAYRIPVDHKEELGLSHHKQGLDLSVIGYKNTLQELETEMAMIRLELNRLQPSNARRKDLENQLKAVDVKVAEAHQWLEKQKVDFKQVSTQVAHDHAH